MSDKNLLRRISIEKKGMTICVINMLFFAIVSVIRIVEKQVDLVLAVSSAFLGGFAIVYLILLFDYKRLRPKYLQTASHSSQLLTYNKKSKPSMNTIQFGFFRLKKGLFLTCFTFAYGMVLTGFYLIVIFGLAKLGVVVFLNLNYFIWNEPEASSNLTTVIVLLGYLTAFLSGLVVWTKREYADRLYFKFNSLFYRVRD